MPLSRGEEMTGQTHRQICGNGEDRYATREDFLKIFDQDLIGLYQLSFLLTGDHQKGERCFVSGIEDCAKENRVFREWARAWAKRVIAENAIRELNPRRKDSSSLHPNSFLSQSAVEQSKRTFRRGLCLRACRLRAVCFRAVRSGALSGTRVRSASWLLGFRSSRRAHSGYGGVSQYLPSGSCPCDVRKRGRLAEAPKA